MKQGLTLAIMVSTVLMTSSLVSFDANAGRYEVHKEIREGYREVNREKREAAREVLRCKTRKCAQREIREGYREVAREKREARREIRHALQDNRHDRWKHNNDNFLTGVIVGGAIIGAAAAIANDND
ncbi:hypothetical protein TUM4438_16640 [Shewanella sairae]|uniref:Secreted protein n=1 Tax=Shewanella sairae TaxID=190310 RepID=A0ABQ4PC80_9GAMM|nr:hypothetical protein [Shewanella sairae]MCL1130203.1 hypothetical protein [Shewanella sairae]GIU44741.1 hypothetical protein TUM4438_16640 [Shewanella sairae]